MNPVRFGIRKPVPVNLLMMAVLMAGVVSSFTLRRQFFPEVEPDKAQISLPYPGATSQEIEKNLVRKVEDALVNIDEVKEIATTISEGGAGITVTFREEADPGKGLDEIERAIDSLRDLPEDAEKIRAELFEPRLPVIRVALYGDVDERALKLAIRGIQDDLRSLPGMGEVVVSGVRDDEIQVRLRRDAMLEHRISLPQISDAIRSWMAEVPGGTIRTGEQELKVRTLGTPERRIAISSIVLRAAADGSVLRVSDVADVVEDLVDESIITRYNGSHSAFLTIFKVGEQDIVRMAEMVRGYVAGRRGQTPEWSLWDRLAGEMIGSARRDGWRLGQTSVHPIPRNAQIDTTSDLSRFVEGRLDLLTRNAAYGALLVFAILLMFLNWRAAWWVGVGLATALLGTMVVMSFLGITLNLLTMFGLIVVLGLLVDDAIVISENIQSLDDQGVAPLEAGERGAVEVLWPVVATVLTSIVAFMPLTFIRGQIGDLLGALPAVVACALAMSLVESVLILPSHMAHGLRKRGPRAGRTGRTARLEHWRDRVFMSRLNGGYRRVLELSLRYRYVSSAVAIATLLVSIGMLAGGRLVFRFLPQNDSDTVIVDIHMPVGTPVSSTLKLVNRIEEVAGRQEETLSTASLVGQSLNIDSGAPELFASHRAQLFVELKPTEQRSRNSNQVIEAMRQMLAGRLDEAERISFSQITGGPAGADITLEIRGDDPARLSAAATEAGHMLAAFDGVHEIADDEADGQLELRLALRPDAAVAGLSVADVARQIRGFAYGLEAHVFSVDQEDVKVRVRLQEADRRKLAALDQAWIISPSGPVPLAEIADVREEVTTASIRRLDRRRVVRVTAATSQSVSPEFIAGAFDLAKLKSRYPELAIRFAGRQEQQREAFASLPYGLLAAMVMIYVILAWLFSSYAQPLIVMLVIPFAFIGVIWGHLFFGYDLNFLSLIGFVALSGIVVNDSLILVSFYNERRAAGANVLDAMLQAGPARLRAILLTTLTTILGLTPLLLEKSFQARFLIPMAISIAIGLLAATVLVLLVVPCFLLIGHDIGRLLKKLWTGRTEAA